MNISPLTRIATALSAETTPTADLISLSMQVFEGLKNEGFCYPEPAYTTTDWIGAAKQVMLGWHISDGEERGRFMVTLHMTAWSAKEWTLSLTVSRAPRAGVFGERLAQSTLATHKPGRRKPRIDPVIYSSHCGRLGDGDYRTGTFSAGDVDQPGDDFQTFLRRFEGNVTAELAC